jgi:hypothetical protein
MEDKRLKAIRRRVSTVAQAVVIRYVYNLLLHELKLENLIPNK